MTEPTYGNVIWKNFVWGSEPEPLRGTFTIEGEEIIFKMKLADFGKIVTGGSFEVLKEETVNE